MQPRCTSCIARSKALRGGQNWGPDLAQIRARGQTTISITFDPAIPLLEMFDPESPWTYEILRDYVNNGHLYNDFFKWIEYFYPKDPEK